jgi:hypothetical protein
VGGRTGEPHPMCHYKRKERIPDQKPEKGRGNGRRGRERPKKRKKALLKLDQTSVLFY